MRLMFYVYLTLAYDNENKLSPKNSEWYTWWTNTCGN